MMKKIACLDLLVAATLAACNRSEGRSYPLRTCVVCDQSYERFGAPVIFGSEGQEVRVCSERDRAEFDKDSRRYLKKIGETKIL